MTGIPLEDLVLQVCPSEVLIPQVSLLVQEDILPVHLHGELKKVRSIIDENEVVELEGWKLTPQHICSKGKPMRPHIVWFGEMVPMITIAEKNCAQADILVVIGTSLNVYPAANLIYHVPQNCELFLIDPNANEFSFNFPIQTFACTASEGTQKLLDILMRKEN